MTRHGPSSEVLLLLEPEEEANAETIRRTSLKGAVGVAAVALKAAVRVRVRKVARTAVSGVRGERCAIGSKEFRFVTTKTHGRS